MSLKSFSPKELSLKNLHGLLLGGIGPRPIALASTIDKEGKPNLSPFSFFNIFSSNPPILIFSSARRVRDNTVKHTLENCQEIPEVVINMVNYDMVHQVSLASTEYDKGVNEFSKSGLTAISSEMVGPFRVKESPMQLECRVNKIIELGDKFGAGNLIICEILKFHIKELILDDNGNINPLKIDLVARMGENWYTRAKEGVFEVDKPLKTKGIGVDNLPYHIRNSSILSGNDLGKLGNIESLPMQNEIINFINKNPNLESKTIEQLHNLAKEYLKKHNVAKALYTLMIKEK